MSINVEHDKNQNSQIALQLLLALTQQPPQGQPQAAAQSPSSDLLAQLAPLTAAGGNGSAPLSPSAAGGDSGAPSYQSHPHRAPSYGSYDGAYGGSSSDEKYANQDALAQYRAQQSDQRLGERSQDQANLREQQDADLMNREQSHDLPPWIQQGLADGSVRYTPDQKRMMSEDQNAHVKVDNDPTFSPDDRARMHAKIAQHDRQNRLNVQRTPADEMPVTPQQQAQQSSWQEVDPISGLTVTKHAGTVRNGAQQEPTLDPVSKIHMEDWADQQKHNRAAQLKQMDLDQKNNEAQAKAAVAIDNRRQRLIARGDRLTPAMHKAYEDYRKAEAELDTNFGDTPPKDAKGTVIQLSEAEKQAAIQRKTDAYYHYGAMQQKWQANNEELNSLGSPADTQAPGAGQAPDQTMEQPAAQQALPVSSPDDLRQQIRNGQLESGDTVMTPSGPHQLTDDDISGA